MEYKINKLSELNEKQVEQATDICVEGLYNVFSIISKDKNLLRDLFMDSFEYDMCYACLLGGEAVGFIGLGNSSKRAAGNMKYETFVRLLGKQRADMMYKGVSSGMAVPKVKFEDEVEIDYFATTPHLRGKGIGKQMILYICDNLPYNSCVLDVYSKNPKAMKFYERLGFKQVSIKSEWVLRLRGIGKTITMRLNTKEVKR